MQPNANHGTQPANEELDMRFNRILTPKVHKPALVEPRYSTDPVAPRRLPNPQRLAQQRPVR